MRIEPFKPEHSSACLEIFESNTPRFFGREELQEFQSFLQQPNAVFLVVSIDGIIRACGGHYHNGNEGWLCWGMVHRDFHGKRVGKALLLERLRQLFADQKIGTVSIHTSQLARPFFEHFGFCRVGAPISNGFAEGIDSLTMRISREEFGKRTNQA